MPAQLQDNAVRQLTGHLLRLGHVKAQRQFHSAMGGDKLSSLQVGIVMVVGDFPGIEHRKLADVLCATKSVLTTALKGLIDDRLIEREISQSDARVIRYQLTDKARRKLPELAAVLRRVDEQILAGLSKDEIRTLNSLLRRISD